MAREDERAADRRVLAPSTQISHKFVGGSITMNFYLHLQRGVVLVQ